MPGPTVLTVDDSADDLMLLSLACEVAQVSFQVQSVQSGETAMAYLGGHQAYADRQIYPLPDLVLLDLKMPGKSGFDVLAWIRGQEHLKQLPVVIFTASVLVEDRERALELGATHFLVKPIGYEALQRLVREIDHLLTAEAAPDFNILAGA